MEAPRVGPSGSPVDGSQAQSEVARLRADLEKATAKLTSWKEKTKIGVDQMRRQVMDLSTALDAARRERDELAKRLTEVPSESSSTNAPTRSPPATFDSPPTAAFAHMASLVTVLGEAQDWFCMYDTAKVDFFSSAAMKACEAAFSSSSTGAEASEASRGASPPQQPHAETADSSAAATPSEDFEAYKRRVTMTLRLQTKNCESLQKQVVELKAALAAAERSLKEKARALAGRDETVALLEQRLEAAERLSRQLEEQHDAFLQVPNMDQVNAMEERVEQELAQVRAEFAARENAIFVQHHDELDRMRAVAEEEQAQVRRECEERLAVAAEEAERRLLQLQGEGRRQANGDGDSVSAASRRGDEGYSQLLSSCDALEQRLRALEDENTALRRDAAFSRANAFGAAQTQRVLARPGATGPADALLPPQLAKSEPASLQEARGTIAEQHAVLVSLAGQLWDAKKELLDLQRKSGTATLPAGALDPQQAVYLKTILVRALCARGEDKVLASLLPVLSTMLGFDGNDLKHIYQANPSWIAAKK